MGEISTGIKVGVVLVIVSLVIAVIFFVLSVSQVYATETYNEQVINMESAKTDINDYIDKEIPMVSFKTILKDYINEKRVTQIVVQLANGSSSATYNEKLNDIWSKYASSTGHIVNLDNSGSLTIRLGG